MTSLKFKSRKDFLFQFSILGIVGFCIGLIVAEGLATGLDKWNYLTIIDSSHSERTLKHQ